MNGVAARRSSKSEGGLASANCALRLENSTALIPRSLLGGASLTNGQISIGDRKSCQGKWLKSGQMQVAFRNRKNPGFLKVRHRGNLSSEPQKDKTPLSFREMGIGVEVLAPPCQGLQGGPTQNDLIIEFVPRDIMDSHSTQAHRTPLWTGCEERISSIGCGRGINEGLAQEG